MAKWHHTVNIKDLLTTDESPDEARRIAAEIRSRLLTLPPGLRNDPDMSDILEGFDEIAHAGSYQAHDVDEFNNVLDMLYDWADYNRVWLGP